MTLVSVSPSAPPPRRPSVWGRLRAAWGWGALSLTVHAVVLFVLLAIVRPFPSVPRAGVPSDTMQIVFFAPDERGTEAPARDTVAGRDVRPEPGPEPPAVAVERRAPVPPDSAPAAVAPGTRRRLGPAYGDGRLWVSPLDVLVLGRRLPGPPVAVAAAPGVGTLDSLVTARLRAFLDSMLPDSFAPPPAPSWTTEIEGKTWGIDGRWIYLGGLKLPAALLALLPLPEGGYNYDQAKAAAALQRMREDILQAAQRAETAAEFNKYVRELRKRKDEERQMKLRVARDTIIPQ